MIDMLERQDGGEGANIALRRLVPREYADWLMMQVGAYEALLIEPDTPETIPAPPPASILNIASL